MRVEGTYEFKAGREAVWAALMSPDVLSSCIPGCRSFEATGVDTYAVELSVGVAAIRGTYSGVVTITDKEHLDSYKMVVEAKGSGGSVRGEGVLRLSAAAVGTAVNVVGDAQVTGIAARVGQRLMGSASKMLMNQLFQCVRAKIDDE